MYPINHKHFDEVYKNRVKYITWSEICNKYTEGESIQYIYSLDPLKLFTIFNSNYIDVIIIQMNDTMIGTANSLSEAKEFAQNYAQTLVTQLTQS